MSFSTVNNKENEKMFSFKNLHSSPHTYLIRATTEIWSQKCFSFSSFLSAETLMKWSKFTDEPLVSSYGPLPVFYRTAHLLS